MWDESEAVYSANDFHKGAETFLRLMMKNLETQESLWVLTNMVSNFIYHAAEDHGEAANSFFEQISRNMKFMEGAVPGDDTQH